MNIIESALLQRFKTCPDQRLIIAYSGGVDSQVLLAALAKLKAQGHLTNALLVYHVHHGLSPHADAWQRFAKQQSQHYGIPFATANLSLHKQPQQSLEAIARDGRYQLLIQASAEPAIIVTGHHLNDQAETFLLSLKRGAGLKGLSAMPADLPLAQHVLARPLLTISRAEIVAYAQQHQLDWVEDESNTDEHYDRNFLRQQVLPILAQRWPSINKTMARSAQHCYEAQQLLDELAEQDLQLCQRSHEQLSIEKLVQLSERRLKNLIRYFLAQHKHLMPSEQQLAQICLQLHAAPDKSPVVQLANACIRRFKQTLYLTDIYHDVARWQQNINLQRLSAKAVVEVLLPDQLGELYFTSTAMKTQTSHSWQEQVKAPKVEQTVKICFAHDNPTCLPAYRQHSRSLKKVLQELAIPPWQRKRLPLLFYDNQLVAVIGHFVCKGYVPTEATNSYFIHWQSKPSV
ncbi:tRNA(Ile)-lysidine synthase [Colwellia chukchiensis]|uniref:tRNA(Ile)-lysidine synthase n=1 Tax=Colwellia chukchiensis TaxID=641665 RepID=A0A1H7K717_9GAMM|nr:tRNA lysidine(34) synthetase TilS [Colwellia chukchiensis]SEK82270.1 tRNA(Ile)-lysidine synthase [Colwellia chukchiensis]